MGTVIGGLILVGCCTACFFKCCRNACCPWKLLGRCSGCCRRNSKVSLSDDESSKDGHSFVNPMEDGMEEPLPADQDNNAVSSGWQHQGTLAIPSPHYDTLQPRAAAVELLLLSNQTETKNNILLFPILTLQANSIALFMLAVMEIVLIGLYQKHPSLLGKRKLVPMLLQGEAKNLNFM